MALQIIMSGNHGDFVILLTSSAKLLNFIQLLLLDSCSLKKF